MVGGVAERILFSIDLTRNPFFGIGFDRQVRYRLRVCGRHVRHGLQIREVGVVPAGAEALHHTAAAFGEARIADFAVIHEDFAPCLVDGLADVLAHCHRQSLISLAMVVCADIE